MRLHGYVAPDELPGLYPDADVLALVSTYEPFGVAVREAAAAGLPLICSVRAGAAGDVAVDGENAVLVDPPTGPRSPPRCAGWCATPTCASGWRPAAGRSPSATRSRRTSRRSSGPC